MSNVGEPSTNDAEVVRVRAAACQKLVDQFIDGAITGPEFLDRLREAGATPSEAEDYAGQANTRSAAKERGRPKTPQPENPQPGSRETTPEGLTDGELEQFRAIRDALIARNEQQQEEQRRKAAEEVEWGVLRAKLGSLLPARHPVKSSFTQSDLERILNIQFTPSSSPTSLPPQLFFKADSHIEETWKLRRAYGTDKSLDPIIDLMQLQILVDPLPRTIWRAVIQDHFVDFEKIYAALGVGYDHRDEPKDFAGEYALVKKEQSLARRAVKTEAEWIRVFAAWRTGVCFLYPHRTAELSGYLQVVTDLFRAVPQDPSVAIRFDAEARDKYAKSPYHMDDRGQHNLTMLSQLFRSPSASGSTKRPSADQAVSGSSSKRATIPCQNWNLGFCEAPCSNRRMHGSCSECGKSHRAKDNDKCLSNLQARRRKAPGGADGAAGGAGA
ncbi:hypothetical protein C8R46DRAFT_1179942 [Mycena filopes]|nr:hypothetical protein C8R46DRAFT_1179942 [Mycena filopes]